MKITDEQIRLALEYLRAPDTHRSVVRHQAESEPDSDSDGDLRDLVKRVLDELESLPDVRDDRVAEARTLLEGDLPGADAVAARLIERLVADQVR